MAISFEKKRITNYQDIDFSTEVYWPLAIWSLEHMQGKVVVFRNGNVLVTEDCIEKQNIIVREMARHIMGINKCYIAEKAVIDDFIEGALDQVGKENNEDEELTTAREDLREIVAYAVDHDVTDIHLEVRKQLAKIRFRKDGDMFTLREWSAQRVRCMCFTAFNRESDDVKKHFNGVIPHDASMELAVKGMNVRVRLASIPAYPYPGFDVVFRILTVKQNVIPLEALGYDKGQMKILQDNIRRKNGAIIIAGATGSGKTTTLASLIRLLPKEKKIYTIEDPVEKKLDNATQIPTNDENSLCTFSSLVRQTLRMDPDCLVIGEVRDEDTANMMSRASITGHLVLTTVHANSAVNIVLRLKDLGLDMSTLTDPNFLAVLGYQTLVKKICQACKKPSENNHHRDILGTEVSVNGEDPNCTQCNGTGVDGRVVVAEMVELGEREYEYIANMQWFQWLKDLKDRKERVVDKVLNLIAAGKVSVRDAESAIGLIHELNDNVQGE